MKTFLVTFIHDHRGRSTTVLRHAENEKAVRRKWFKDRGLEWDEKK